MAARLRCCLPRPGQRAGQRRHCRRSADHIGGPGRADAGDAGAGLHAQQPGACPMVAALASAGPARRAAGGDVRPAGSHRSIARASGTPAARVQTQTLIVHLALEGKLPAVSEARPVRRHHLPPVSQTALFDLRGNRVGIIAARAGPPIRAARLQPICGRRSDVLTEVLMQALRGAFRREPP